MNKIPRSFGTHDGTFHADEVTATALLLLTNRIDRDLIFRTRDLELLAKCEFVCDVGGIYDPEKKLFDHHQADYTGPLSSAGMVLEYLRDHGDLSADEYQIFQQTIIAGVDAHDNGLDPAPPGVSTYSHIIGNFMPIHYESSKEEQETAFQAALNFALGHLGRMRERFHYIKSTRDTVEAAMIANKDCLMFERSLPWLDSFFDLKGELHSATFVIMPSGDHWKLRGIPPKITQKMKVRHPLPLEWAGLLGEELKQATGIPGAIFCHKGRFISVWETKEDALKALEKVLKNK